MPEIQHNPDIQRRTGRERDPETQWDVVSSVGLTALAVAGGRSVESQRSDRLVHDPFADSLVQAANPETPLPGLDATEENPEYWQEMTSYLGVRSRFFDEFFDSACADGARQAVILASGLDTRPYRMRWPGGFRVFEIDQPLVLEFKNTVLSGLSAEPTCDLRPVAVDLRDDWPSALHASGFDPSAPTAWLAEGLLPYLPPEAEQQLLAKTRELSAPGSRIAIESLSGSRTQLIEKQRQHLPQDTGIDLDELFNTEDRADPAEQLTAFGWTVRKQPSPEVAAGFGRELSGFAQVLSEQQYFLTAELPR